MGVCFAFALSDDLTFLKCFGVIFSSKSKYPIFAFIQSLFSTKMSSKSCQFGTYQRKVLFEFLTSQTGQVAFIIFKIITRYLCISLTH